ncbi:MAG: ATP-binding protein involved in chromosome partitioning [Paraglaciecola sp.]|jgi:ATP-binding protein involved in chromosome partitioning
MFFNRPSHEQKMQNCAAQCLAAAFALNAKQVQSWITVADAKMVITLPFPAQSQHTQLQSAINTALDEEKLKCDELLIETVVTASPTRLAKINNIKNIIAVASGKGGVGKSTTSVNLAFALMAQGAKVGLLDADIYGPSVPIMLGNTEAKPTSHDDKRIQPLEAHGLVASSIGYFVPAEDATVWRGPMASKALQQLVNETDWPELDYLIVDMPPGTGDIQLTLAQNMPVSAAVIITTPQDLALADARKGIAMFEKVTVPVLGLIENMSYYLCPHCGHEDHIFAQGGGDKLATENKLPLLGQLPLNAKIRQYADDGKPLLLELPDDPLSVAYKQLATALTKQLYLNTLDDLRVVNV